MSDMMQGPVGKNMSIANPTDAAAMISTGQVNGNMTVRDYLGKLGIDVDGPISQLQQFAQKTMENASPMGKMRNISADAALQPGGQPSARPGVKPMVQPPGKPSPSGLEGLMNRLGG